MTEAIYDTIGQGYSTLRRADPRIEAQIHAALGQAETVLNVGAGAGSYEPHDGRTVVAVEPSAVMRAQRPAGSAPCVEAVAEALPIAGASFDAAMVVLSVHHWTDWRAGLAELRRVSERQVIMTFAPSDHGRWWLIEDYLPEIVDLPGSNPPRPEEMAEALGGGRVETIPVPHDCVDAFLPAFWRRPEAYLDPVVQAANSGFAQTDQRVVEVAMARLADDLASGEWDRKHGHVRALESLDTGFRLVVT